MSWTHAVAAQVDDALFELGRAQTQLDHTRADDPVRANLADRVGELTRKLDYLLAAGELEEDHEPARRWGDTPDHRDLDDVA
jgi:hypothetical protein